MLYSGRHKAIRNLRVRRGLTQKEVEERGGIVEGTVSKWERGERFPSNDQIEKILLGLGCTEIELWEEIKKDERQHYVQLAIERKERLPDYDVSILADQVHRLLILEMENLPETLRSEFNEVRKLMASQITQHYSLIDRLVALHNKLSQLLKLAPQDAGQDPSTAN